MKFIDEYQDPRLVKGLLQEIGSLANRRFSFMEVCGTHTMALFRYGLRAMLPELVKVLAGPGCPVCVTPMGVLDAAIEAVHEEGVMLTTFGDMMRVPGSESSLEAERALGYDVRVVYSCLDSLGLAERNPRKKVIFLGVGFETTSPSIACTVLQAAKGGIGNFKLISAHKLIPPAMKALLEAGEVKLDGFICPGHVSTIIGSEPYEFIPKEYGIPCVISGFEPVDILQSVLLLLRQIKDGLSIIEIQYSRSVKPDGNPIAKRYLSEVFEISDSDWRGLGRIPQSGLVLRDRYGDYDALRDLGIELKGSAEPPGCSCGDILRGAISPPECGLFGSGCTPEHPIGPCMVSSEGTCAAYYRYGRA
jgi:hydrogenase expression/formation protein HypD